MAQILTEITNAAVEIFQARSKVSSTQSSPHSFFQNSDSVLSSAQELCQLPPESGALLKKLCSALKKDNDFKSLLPIEGELDPMILHPGGGYRASFYEIVGSVFFSAFLHLFYLRLPNDESVYVRVVIENFEELKRAVQGESIRSYVVKGLAGITLPEGSQVSTPWGIIRPAPRESDRVTFLRLQPATKCILAEQQLIQVVFDRAASPELPFASQERLAANADSLMQLSCALSSPDPKKPIAPLLTWSTLLLPFQSGFSYLQPHLPFQFIGESNIEGQIEDIEEWSRVIKSSHASAVDIAVHRLISSIAHRTDRTDALIDAVMVWENLFGTHNEVTFRVSAALAALIESGDVESRKQLFKDLKSIYGLRSRIVHGGAADQTEVNDACTKAIEIAITALKISYTKGYGWLSMKSSERSDSILLRI